MCGCLLKSMLAWYWANHQNYAFTQTFSKTLEFNFCLIVINKIMFEFVAYIKMMF